MAQHSKRMMAAALAVSIVLVLPASSQAGFVTLYDTLTEVGPFTGADGIGSFDEGPLEDSFTTGISAVKLTDLKFVLEGPPGQDTLQVNLFADRSTAPGTLLQSFGNLNIGANTLNNFSGVSFPTLVDFPVNNSNVLAPNTRYWVGLSNNFTQIRWDWTTSIGEEGEFSASQRGIIPVLVPEGIGGISYRLEINATTVPEPTSLVVFETAFASAAGFGAWKRRRARKSLTQQARAATAE